MTTQPYTLNRTFNVDGIKQIEIGKHPGIAFDREPCPELAKLAEEYQKKAKAVFTLITLSPVKTEKAEFITPHLTREEACMMLDEWRRDYQGLGLLDLIGYVFEGGYLAGHDEQKQDI